MTTQLRLFPRDPPLVTYPLTVVLTVEADTITSEWPDLTLHPAQFASWSQVQTAVLSHLRPDVRIKVRCVSR